MLVRKARLYDLKVWPRRPVEDIIKMHWNSLELTYGNVEVVLTFV